MSKKPIRLTKKQLQKLRGGIATAGGSGRSSCSDANSSVTACYAEAASATATARETPKKKKVLKTVAPSKADHAYRVAPK